MIVVVFKTENLLRTPVFLPLRNPEFESQDQNPECSNNTFILTRIIITIITSYKFVVRIRINARLHFFY